VNFCVLANKVTWAVREGREKKEKPTLALASSLADQSKLNYLNVFGACIFWYSFLSHYGTHLLFPEGTVSLFFFFLIFFFYSPPAPPFLESPETMSSTLNSMQEASMAVLNVWTLTAFGSQTPYCFMSTISPLRPSTPQVLLPSVACFAWRKIREPFERPDQKRK